ncbi:hypothetical protein HF086_014995 [Spodoptera exigua]|uniref:Smoothelin domain-containing protein n=1 Tax=Spodoptera exigua TaxID=7107 RepID=A0A922MEM6_SPOEX|nr:hypothetical protein HF086_014995 [Spodoptera exigua]
MLQQLALCSTFNTSQTESFKQNKDRSVFVVCKETVRTSSSGGGKVTSTQTRSIEDFDVDQCWDERLLRKLLDECNDYEQRRRLRARIRTLMAEQEACASAVTEALAAAGEAEGAEGDSRGESLLLPLLQGLLGGGGERLLAGLGAAPADVVADVRRSLGRLRAALAPPTEHPQARALLSLADRLEDALDAADRLDGCRRKPRRRSRAARHTVGVTHEELEEARRLVDRDQLALGAKGPLSSGATSTASMATSTDEPSTPERKQSIDENVSYHDAVASRQKPTPVAHSVSYEAPKVNRDAHVVVEKRAPTTRKPDFYRHSVADTGSQRSQPHQQMQPFQQLQQQAPPTPPAPEPQHARVPHVPYQPQPLHQSYQPQPRMERRPSDSKSSIAAIANKFDSRAQKENIPRRAPIEPVSTQQKEFNKRAPLYMPLPPTYNFAAPPTATQDDSKPLNRFSSSNNKRLRMKRANTIDIGRPLAGYRIDSDNDDETSPRPIVPEFRPQTENDRKFVAFMKKNEAADRDSANINGPANWSSRFGNIKNAFESREREDNINVNSRSSSASSARRFWRTADETTVNPASARPRKFFNANNNDIVKPPWVNERREPMRVHIPRQVQHPPAPSTAPVSLPTHRPAPVAAPTSAPILPPAPAPAPAPINLATSIAPPHHPPVPQSPTKPLVVKPFVARPIPVNQFSHAPMSAFKPPTKVTSPTAAPAYIWSPPSVMKVTSPPVDHTPAFPVNPGPIAPSPPAPSKPWATDADKPRRVVGIAATKFEANKQDLAPAPYRERPSAFHPPAPQTHAPAQIQNYPMKTIPSQNDLSAPELVRKADDTKLPPQDAYLPKVDAQKLQIEFYEKQIREKNRRDTVTNGHSDPMERKPPAPPAYTITDYTPSNGISTFVPLQRTPDIEKARAHKVDYLPDVVTNDTDRQRNGASPLQGRAPTSPYSPRATNVTESPHAYQNGDVPYANGVDEGVTTEHDSVVTRVMRGPVRGAATITAGVRTRNDEGRRGSAADSLRGALDKLSSPKNDVINQIERKKRETARSQVRAPVNTGRSPLLAPTSPHATHSPGGLAASRESVLSSESAGSLGSNPLSRSGSWHQMVASPKSASPRRVVARAKSMHLLAVPKLYEGGIAREEITEKKRTVEAYFSGQQPQQARPSAGSSRPRALRQSYAPPQPYSLGRSRTMPTVSELQFLDESNTEDAFEDLVSALA